MAILGIAVVARVLVGVGESPMFFGDSDSYLQLAAAIGRWQLVGFDGARTPGYPLVLLALGGMPKAIWLFQAMLGLMSTVLLHHVTRQATGNRWLSAAVASMPTVMLNQLFFEANILTESLTTASMVAIVATMGQRNVVDRAPAAAAGGLIAFTILTRPLTIVVLPAVAWWLVQRPADSIRQRLVRVARVVLAAATPLLLWCAIVNAYAGQFTITTLLGYNLSQHSGAWMQEAGDEHAAIRDPYLRHRRQRIEATGSHAMTIWHAHHEIRAATGWSLPQLSRELVGLSWQLIASHPRRYAASVYRSWKQFWHPTAYWRHDDTPVLGAVWLMQGWLLRGFAYFFLACALVHFGHLLLTALHDRRVPSLTLGSLVALIVLGASVLQALFEQGENARYSLPFEPLMALFVALEASSWLRRARLATVMRNPLKQQ